MSKKARTSKKEPPADTSIQDSAETTESQGGASLEEVEASVIDGDKAVEQETDGEREESQQRVEELEREVAGLRDQLLRKQADFENYRKRMLREKEESVRYANAALLADLIEVIDDFERAIRSSEESRDFDAFHEGIALIERRLVDGLEKKWGLVRLQSLNEPFDPEVHQAIATEEREEFDKPVVLEEYQRGYKLYDRVLRPAKVKVSAPAREQVVVSEKEEE